MNESVKSPRLYDLCGYALRFGFALYNRWEVHGAENVPKDGGCVIASNHVSFLDPALIGAAVRHRPVRFMARDTLFRNPLFGRFLRNILVMPISREKGDIGALKRSIEALRRGSCVGVFPEGTRSVTGELQPAKGGIGFLIAKAGVPVVPVYLDGSYRAYPKGGKFIKPCKIRIFIGQPIKPEELTSIGEDREGYATIGRLIMERISELRP
jgi:1-acyl-sn-glycerol-3-phosphate acyltransferase